MEEKCATLKLQLAGKAKEAEYVCEVDRLALSGDREQTIQHRKAMTAYRDENKRVHSHTCIMYPLLMLLCTCQLLSGYNTGSVCGYPHCHVYLCVWVCVCVCS